jgi:hypothetical protein
VNITRVNGVPCRKPFAKRDTAQDAILSGDKMTGSKIISIMAGVYGEKDTYV